MMSAETSVSLPACGRFSSSFGSSGESDCVNGRVVVYGGQIYILVLHDRRLNLNLQECPWCFCWHLFNSNSSSLIYSCLCVEHSTFWFPSLQFSQLGLFQAPHHSWGF